jgi:hypothetical protein
MNIHEGIQSGEEWDDLRAGRITGSVSKKFITAKGNPSTQAKGEVGRIIAESLGLQEPVPHPVTYWMERGTDMESEARKWMQVVIGYEIHQCAFISDGDDAGFSPDGYTMENDILIPAELKVPKPGTHISWLLDGGLPDDHKQQCHFSLVITDAPYMRFMSYHPDMRPLSIKVERGEYTDKLAAELKKFRAALATAKQQIMIGEDE